MGNPSIQGDGGSCWECEHYRGVRTAPERRPLTLCGEGMLTFRFMSLPPATGCRYWRAIEPAERLGEFGTE